MKTIENDLKSLVNDDIEKSFLGCLLLDPKCFDRASWFDAAFFGIEIHGKIFDAIKMHRVQGRDYCPEMIAQYFSNDNDLTDIGGAGYLKDLANSVISIMSVKGYANHILSLHYRRMALMVAKSMEDLSINSSIDTPPETLLSNLDTILTEARNLKIQDTSVGAGDSARAALQAAKNPKHGIKSGFHDLDKITGGFKPAEFTVIAGRPGMGKTAMGLTLAVNAALAGNRVLFFSLEMAHIQLMQRILSRFSGQAVHSGDIQKDMDSALERASGLMLDIDDASGLTAQDICARASIQKRRNGVDMVIVDYLGLVVPSDKKINKVHQIEETTQAMKRLSKDLSIPVIVLSQLSRALEGRDDKRPSLGDLRDSGAIEQDADTVIFIYRDEYYEKKQPKFKGRNQEVSDMVDREENKGMAELIVAKNRQGRLGSVDLKFNGEHQVFHE